MLLRRLLLTATSCSLATATLSATTNVELHRLAQAHVPGSREATGDNRKRLSLQHLESMWHTSLGHELDRASSGRERAFRATLDSEWARLRSSRDSGGKVPLNKGNVRDRLVGDGSSASTLQRSPFLVCTDRHPDAIRALESMFHRTHTQLTYSRGDTACVLAGLRLEDVEALRELEWVHAVEPLPHPAKLSRSLYAELEPLADGEKHASHASRDNGQRSATKMAQEDDVEYSEASSNDDGPSSRRQTGARPSSPRNIRFNHGEGLPNDLDVSLTPGTWGLGLADKWTQHLTSFGSTGRLWDDHLREQLLWTRSDLDTDLATRAAGARTGAGEKEVEDIGALRNAVVTEHGLSDTASLWEQAAASSSRDGACELGRLRAVSESSQGVREGSAEGAGRRHRGGSGSSKGTSGETHDRIVLRGVGGLGKTEQDDAHCLLAVMAYLMTRPEVAYVDDLPQVVPLNIEAAWITQSGEEATYSVWDQGIDGRTEIIAMADSGLDMKSCFFREDDSADNIDCSDYNSPIYDLTKRKVVQYVGFVDCVDTEGGHGTHVAGSAAGALSETSPGGHFGDGSGFRAKLAVFDFGNDEGGLVTPSNLQTQMLAPPYAIGARVSTNSWGAVRTTYTSLDRQVDSFAYAQPDMVIVVAAGNCGDEISQCSYQGNSIYGAGSILSPALAKNVITVGASEASPSSAGLADNVDEVAYFSSQGPTTDDGRIKPDIVAPGYHLFSATANPDSGDTCEIGPMAGTSMATPIVAGTAAMVRQYFVQGWYPTGLATPSDMFNPSNALIKAMLITSGTAMTSYDGTSGSTSLDSPPDGIQGFGRVLLDSVLNMHGSVDLRVEDWNDMGHGEVHSYFVDMDGVSSSAYEGDMKVTMVFMEQAAYSSSVAPVYNDLDLLVVGYDGTSETSFYPNNLATKDSANTVEMVTISAVDSYEWFNVTVTGDSVTTSSLPYYALVITGGVAGDYSPTSFAGRSWFVRWEMTVEGIPVVQAATAAFEAGLAEAVSSETGEYTSDNSTVLVKIDKTTTTAEEDEDTDSRVTIEISVDSETHGYAVLTYVIAVVDGSSITADTGLAAALNDALQSRYTDGCECVATPTSAEPYNCSACEEGGEFLTAESIATVQGGYDLLSTEGAGNVPVSVFAPDETDGDDDLFWNDVAGGQHIRGVIRTESYADVAAVVATIVALTSLCGCCLRAYLEKNNGAQAGLGSTGGVHPSAGDHSGNKNATGRKAIGRRSPAGRKPQRRGMSGKRVVGGGVSFGDSPESPATPGVVPERGQAGESKYTG